MIKKLLLAAVAVSAIAATPAMATSTDFAVTGTVNASCGGLTTSAISFPVAGIATDATTGALTASQSAFVTTAAYCNGVNSTIAIVVKDALKTSTVFADTTNFTDTLVMSPTVTHGSTVYGSTPTKIGEFSGNLTVSTGNLTASKKPVAGSYVGSVTVTLSPVA